MGFQPLDLKGQRFGRLTVVDEAGRRWSQVIWNCVCDCGERRIVSAGSLRRGRTASCGCLGRENARQASVKHGGSASPLYHVWRSMVDRCGRTTHPAWPRYGGRGITVCDRWGSFVAFRDDMGRGYAPGLSIERIDNNAGYSPDNCRWANVREQARNRRSNTVLVVNGKSLTLTEAAELHGIHPGTLGSRLKRGWSLTDALTTPTPPNTAKEVIR